MAERTIEIPEIKLRRMVVGIVGQTPLLTNRFGEKAREKIEAKQQKKAKGAREARNPYVEMWTRFDDCFLAVVNQIGEFEAEFKSERTAEHTDEALAKLVAWRDQFTEVAASWTAAREQIAFIMDAISDAEKTFGRLGPKERECLNCNKTFLSSGIMHRLCQTCASADSGLDEIEMKALR